MSNGAQEPELWPKTWFHKGVHVPLVAWPGKLFSAPMSWDHHQSVNRYYVRHTHHDDHPVCVIFIVFSHDDGNSSSLWWSSFPSSSTQSSSQAWAPKKVCPWGLGWDKRQNRNCHIAVSIFLGHLYRKSFGWDPESRRKFCIFLDLGGFSGPGSL